MHFYNLTIIAEKLEKISDWNQFTTIKSQIYKRIEFCDHFFDDWNWTFSSSSL